MAQGLSELVSLAQRIQARCVASGVTLATAESCTGGLVGHVITEVPGSSDYFVGGVVAYSDELKERLLDVPRSALEHHGAVSAQVARAMAQGARRRSGATLAVSVTGIAGPDGGTAAKPVGLTYVGFEHPGGDDVRRFQWSGDRAQNKHDAARAALELILEHLAGAEGSL